MSRAKAGTASKGGFDYAEFLRSDLWRLMRRWKLATADYRCQLCASPDKPEVHHRSYERVGGDELESDLVVLCSDCHEKYHGVTEPQLVVEVAERRGLDITPNIARWGEWATRVAEINREIQFSTPSRQAELLLEKDSIARSRRYELQGVTQ